MTTLADARSIVTAAIGKISAQRADPATTPAQLAGLDAALQTLLPALHAIERMQLDQAANAVAAATAALRAVTASAELDTLGQLKQEVSALLRGLDDAPPAPAEAPTAPPPAASPAMPATGTKLLNSTRFDDLRDEYLRLYESCAVAPGKEALVRGEVARLLAGRARYEAVAADVPGMPWYLIGIIHGMEASYRFDRHLHNGDPLTGRTVNVPAGRPIAGEPPFTWEESARDALALDGLTKQTDFSIAQLLYRFEKYNGFGYRSRGVPTPYLWGGSIHYRSGKFVADHQFSETAVSAQIGAAVLVKELTRQETPPVA
jgi:lysozyme family protein